MSGHTTGPDSEYTPELGAQVIARLSQGVPLAVICRDPAFPFTRKTVNVWRKRFPDFEEACLHARDDGFDAIAWRTRATARGKGPEEGGDSTGDVQRDKLIIEQDNKLLSKWDVRRYGDRLQTENRTVSMTHEEWLASLK